MPCLHAQTFEEYCDSRIFYIRLENEEGGDSDGG